MTELLGISSLYQFFVDVLNQLFGIDIPSAMGQAREVLENFYSLFSGFPPLFLQLVGFALAGIVIGIIIRLL